MHSINRRSDKSISSRNKIVQNKGKKKLYSASGQAPPPCKDFFELVVFHETVIWRKWRLKYSKDGRVVPSEEKFSRGEFLDSDMMQNEIERYLGDDILNMGIGYLTKSWLPRLPTHVLVKITSNLKVKDICNLQQVCFALNKRLKKDEIWRNHLLHDFQVDTSKISASKKGFRKCYIQEVRKKKENQIDWDNI